VRREFQEAGCIATNIDVAGSSTSARGRTDLQNYVSTVQNAKSPADGSKVLGPINQLPADCPS
jgi:hypothetical protein